jgi:hypothetical protein
MSALSLFFPKTKFANATQQGSFKAQTTYATSAINTAKTTNATNATPIVSLLGANCQTDTQRLDAVAGTGTGFVHTCK